MLLLLCSVRAQVPGELWTSIIEPLPVLSHVVLLPALCFGVLLDVSLPHFGPSSGFSASFDLLLLGHAHRFPLGFAFGFPRGIPTHLRIAAAFGSSRDTPFILQFALPLQKRISTSPLCWFGYLIQKRGSCLCSSRADLELCLCSARTRNERSDALVSRMALSTSKDVVSCSKSVVLLDHGNLDCVHVIFFESRYKDLLLEVGPAVLCNSKGDWSSSTMRLAPFVATEPTDDAMRLTNIALSRRRRQLVHHIISSVTTPVCFALGRATRPRT